MTAPGYASIAFGCALALGLTACAGEESPEPQIAYTVTPSVEVPPADAGMESSVETNEQTCVSSSDASITAPVPSGWQTEVSDVDNCRWSSGEATLTLTYGDIPDDDEGAWRWVIDEHQTAQLEGTIPGYRFTRYTENEGGGPLWHYRYIDDEDAGGVYLDSFNLYRGGWQISYEAESTSYNTYLADQLIDNATLA